MVELWMMELWIIVELWIVVELWMVDWGIEEAQGVVTGRDDSVKCVTAVCYILPSLGRVLVLQD